MVVQAYLERNNIEVLPHPLHSPELTLCDYWLFPTLKKAIWGWHFDSDDEVVNATHTFFNSLPQKDFEKMDQHQVGKDGEVCEVLMLILRESGPTGSDSESDIWNFYHGVHGLLIVIHGVKWNSIECKQKMRDFSEDSLSER